MDVRAKQLLFKILRGKVYVVCCRFRPTSSQPLYAFDLTSANFKNMDLMLLRTFQQQVLTQCEFLLLAADDVNVSLNNHNTTRVFYALQNLLNAAANISKALWGQGGRLAAQRRTLRDSIGISDDSPLRNVTMRNNFEHFDERLDKWWNESERHNNVDFNIMPKSMIVGADSIDLFRNFDPQTTDLWFWSQEFNTQEIITEVQRILPTLRAEADKPHLEATSESQAE